MNTTTQTLRIIGMNDEQTECDLCGRMELRGTVVVHDEDGVEVGRYGTTCVAKVVAGVTRFTRNDGALREESRRANVRSDFRKAIALYRSGDQDGARWYVGHLRRFVGLHRADELALAEKIEAGTY